MSPVIHREVKIILLYQRCLQNTRSTQKPNRFLIFWFNFETIFGTQMIINVADLPNINDLWFDISWLIFIYFIFWPPKVIDLWRSATFRSPKLSLLFQYLGPNAAFTKFSWYAPPPLRAGDPPPSHKIMLN